MKKLVFLFLFLSLFSNYSKSHVIARQPINDKNRFENKEPIHLINGEPFFLVKGRTSSSFKPGRIIRISIANYSLCELADESGNPFEKVVLKTYSIEHSTGQKTGSDQSDFNNNLFIFPNPAENIANIKYKIAYDCFVNISLYNVLGEKVIEIVNTFVLKGSYNSQINITSILPGVYTCKMCSGNKEIIIKRIIISK